MTEFEQDEMAYNTMELCGTTKTKVSADEYLCKHELKGASISGDIRDKCFCFNSLTIAYNDDTDEFVVKPCSKILDNNIERRFQYNKLKKDEEYFDKFFDFCYNWKKKVLIKVSLDDCSYKNSDFPEEWMTYKEFESLFDKCLNCITANTIKKGYPTLQYDEKINCIFIGNVILIIEDIDVSKAIE